MTVPIIYEDNHILVVNKPFNMPSQGDDTGDLNVFDWAKEYIRLAYNKPGNVYVALLHRLDRPTGGILMVGKTSKAAARLSEDFQQNRIQKTYYAITEKAPNPTEGELFHYLAKLPDKNKNIVRAYDKQVFGAKPAKLTYHLLQTHNGKSLLEVQPHTGRQHQIRVQLASMGCVICGDVKYGKTNFLEDKSIALLAKKIEFMHPVKKEKMTLEIALPKKGIWELFEEK